MILINKYNIPHLRCASCTKLPYWEKTIFLTDGYTAFVSKSFEEGNERQGFGAYRYLPFYESRYTLGTWLSNHNFVQNIIMPSDLMPMLTQPQTYTFAMPI